MLSGLETTQITHFKTIDVTAAQGKAELHAMPLCPVIHHNWRSLDNWKH